MSAFATVFSFNEKNLLTASCGVGNERTVAFECLQTWVDVKFALFH